MHGGVKSNSSEIPVYIYISWGHIKRSIHPLMFQKGREGKKLKGTLKKWRRICDFSFGENNSGGRIFYLLCAMTAHPKLYNTGSIRICNVVVLRKYI